MSSINHPKHYNSGSIEPIDVIEDWNLNFHLGNALKYIARCNYKGRKKEDILKAIWYLEREVQREGEDDTSNNTRETSTIHEDDTEEQMGE